MMEYSNELADRLALAVAGIAASEQPGILDRRLSAWLEPTDYHVPQVYLVKRVRDFLTLTYDELYETHGLGNRRIEKLISVLERVTAAMPVNNFEGRFLDIAGKLKSLGDPALLRRPFGSWVSTADSHLPQSFLHRPLGEILAAPFAELARVPGVGVRRIEKVLGVLERAHREALAEKEPAATPASSSRVPPPAPFLTESLGAVEWRNWCGLLRAHRMEHDALGQYAGSLSDLPQGVWASPLNEYCDLTLFELRYKLAPKAFEQILALIAEIVRALRESPPDLPFATRFTPVPIRDASAWIRAVLRYEAIPGTASIRAGFLEPLLTLFGNDLGADAVAMLRRRIGVDGPPETLERIAIDAGLTRERVRQITARAFEVLRIRWPEGRVLVGEAYGLFRAATGVAEQLALFRAVIEAMFDPGDTLGATLDAVLARWDRAGRNKRTPMDEPTVRAWATEEFSEMPATTIGGWLDAAGMRHTDANGEVLYFSRDPLDELLIHARARPGPLPIGEVTAFLGGDERSARGRIERDLRFIEDESRGIQPAERYSFRRRERRWFLRLDSLGGGGSTVEIAVSDFIHLVVGGMLRIGIADATVWGVHRCARALVEAATGAALAPALTPFILAGVLVGHSEGLVRIMRKRRLRWERAGGTLPARGKMGWIDHLATAAGVAMTLDELDAVLREHYQDYEPWVLKQLHLADEDEGESAHGFCYLPGTSKWVPGMILPSGWHFDPAAPNISDGVKQTVARIVDASARAPIAKELLRRIPWMIPLCEAHGPMRWGVWRGKHNLSDEAETG